MRQTVSMELYAYWNALRRGRPAPERNEVEPGAIRTVLADTFVLDFDTEIGFPFRISGSRINNLFQRELRGLSFLKLWRETDRREVQSVLQRVAEEARPCLLGAETRPPGVGSVHVEILLLPLRHRGSTRSRILGSVTADEGASWLGLVGLGVATLNSVRGFLSDLPAGARRPMVTVVETQTRPACRSLFSSLRRGASR